MRAVIRVVALTVPLLGLNAAWGDEAAKTEPAKAGLGVWDTRRPSTEALTPAALAAKSGWTAIPPGQTPVFDGDAVLSTGRVVAVLRQQDSAIDVYSANPDGPTARLRVRLETASGEPAERLQRVALVENTRNSAAF